MLYFINCFILACYKIVTIALEKAMNITNRLQTDFSIFFDELSESHIRLRCGLEIKLTD